jgi:hypothetical protein
MLTPDDRRAIEGLFERLHNVEMQGAPIDREADEMIRRAIEQQPSAPFYMAQTIVVQEQALDQAQRRIAELEDAVQRARSGDLEGEPLSSSRARGPWDRDSRDEDRRERWGGRGYGGGFLAGAMQTALGVTGGLLLGSALGSLFGAGEANAADDGQPDPDTSADADTPADAYDDQDPDVDDDIGDAGDFDTGGDF